MQGVASCAIEDSALSSGTDLVPECTSREGGLPRQLAPRPGPRPKRRATEVTIGDEGTPAKRAKEVLAPLEESCAGADSNAWLGESGGSELQGPLVPTATPDLCCAESALSQEFCSTHEPGDEFAVFQSPLSLDPEAPGGAGNALLPPPPAGPPAAVQCKPQPSPLACDPELAEMLSVLYESEALLHISHSYMDAHGEGVQPKLFLDVSMRRTAVGWLVEVAHEFGLHQETLFLAVTLLDRFLSVAKSVPRTQLQLVAVSCMLIASKHEEEVHPSILDFTTIADNCFMAADLLRMESAVLDALGFRVNCPTAHTFLTLLRQAYTLQPRTCALACYLSELALLEYDMLGYRPSHIAAASALLAQAYFGDCAGLRGMAALGAYTPPEDLRPCMRQLLALQREAFTAHDFNSPCIAVRDKYRSPQWFCAGEVTPFEKLPTRVLPASASK